jgi:hypothetical protein
MHINKVRFIMYYSLKYFGCFCDHLQDVIQEYKQLYLFLTLT